MNIEPIICQQIRHVLMQVNFPVSYIGLGEDTWPLWRGLDPFTIPDVVHRKDKIGQDTFKGTTVQFLQGARGIWVRL